MGHHTWEREAHLRGTSLPRFADGVERKAGRDGTGSRGGRPAGAEEDRRPGRDGGAPVAVGGAVRATEGSGRASFWMN